MNNQIETLHRVIIGSVLGNEHINNAYAALNNADPETIKIVANRAGFKPNDIDTHKTYLEGLIDANSSLVNTIDDGTRAALKLLISGDRQIVPTMHGATIINIQPTFAKELKALYGNDFSLLDFNKKLNKLNPNPPAAKKPSTLTVNETKPDSPEDKDPKKRTPTKRGNRFTTPSGWAIGDNTIQAFIIKCMKEGMTYEDMCSKADERFDNASHSTIKVQLSQVAKKGGYIVDYHMDSGIRKIVDETNGEGCTYRVYPDGSREKSGRGRPKRIDTVSKEKNS